MNPYSFDLSLRVLCDSLDPEEVSKELQLTPRVIQRIGEPRKTPKGTALVGVYDHSYCLFNLEKEPDKRLPERLDKICHWLAEHQPFLARIRGSGGRIVLSVGWYVQRNSGDEFDYALLTKLGTLGIDLSLDVYAETPSDKNQVGSDH